MLTHDGPEAFIALKLSLTTLDVKQCYAEECIFYCYGNVVMLNATYAECWYAECHLR
jgi:hypothetical protein